MDIIPVTKRDIAPEEKYLCCCCFEYVYDLLEQGKEVGKLSCLHMICKECLLSVVDATEEKHKQCPKCKTLPAYDSPSIPVDFVNFSTKRKRAEDENGYMPTDLLRQKLDACATVPLDENAEKLRTMPAYYKMLMTEMTRAYRDELDRVNAMFTKTMTELDARTAIELKAQENHCDYLESLRKTIREASMHLGAIEQRPEMQDSKQLFYRFVHDRIAHLVTEHTRIAHATVIPTYVKFTHNGPVLEDIQLAGPVTEELLWKPFSQLQKPSRIWKKKTFQLFDLESCVFGWTPTNGIVIADNIAKTISFVDARFPTEKPLQVYNFNTIEWVETLFSSRSTLFVNDSGSNMTLSIGYSTGHRKNHSFMITEANTSVHISTTHTFLAVHTPLWTKRYSFNGHVPLVDEEIDNADGELNINAAIWASPSNDDPIVAVHGTQSKSLLVSSDIRHLEIPLTDTNVDCVAFTEDNAYILVFTQNTFCKVYDLEGNCLDSLRLFEGMTSTHVLNARFYGNSLYIETKDEIVFI